MTDKEQIICKYKFKNKEKFNGKPYCLCHNELCEDLFYVCDHNCQIYEDYKQLVSKTQECNELKKECKDLKRELTLYKTWYRAKHSDINNLLGSYYKALDEIERYCTDYCDGDDSIKTYDKCINCVSADIKDIINKSKGEKMKEIGELKILSEFRPADRLNELEEVPKIGNYINYWQAAKMLCEKDGGHLASREELAQLASNLYVDSSGNAITFSVYTDKSNLKLKDKYKDNPPLTLGYRYWSSEEYFAGRAYYRLFYTTGSYWYNGAKRSSSRRAICVSN